MSNKRNNSISTDYPFKGINFWHHVLFWSIYFFLNFLRWGSYHSDYLYAFNSNLIGFPIHIALCYFNIYVLMPRLLFKKKYLAYVVLIITAIFLMVVVKFNLTYYLLNTNVWPEGPKVTNTLSFDYVVDMMIGELYVITFVTAIKITMDWLYENKRVNELQKIQLETELLFLRSQISPHFFFNTLNNIYALAVEKSDKTPKLIIKLSELMRYFLYETGERKQDLDKEIIYIENYLELEKLRYGEQLNVTTTITGNIADAEISPMLLLAFVENAFKHGGKKNLGHINITLDFVIKEEFLYFTIRNPLPGSPVHKKTPKPIGGIGLKNVRKRLELGYDPEDYDLRIMQNDKEFIIELKIKVKWK